MTRYVVAITAVIVLNVAAEAQFKTRGDSQPSVIQSVTRNDGNGLLFGWFDPNRLFVKNSYELSYMTMGGGQGMSLGTLTSSLNYQISDPLSVAFDVSLMHQPLGGMNSRQSDFSGVYLTRAQLDYRPSKNMLFQIQFRQLPAMYWLNNPGYGFFRSGPAGFAEPEVKTGEEQP